MWFDILKVQMELDTTHIPFNPTPGIKMPSSKTSIDSSKDIPKEVNTQESSDGGSDDSSSDDSDVGEQWRNIRSLMVQSPRGPKKRQLVQALSILANAAIDPVNQKNLAIQAKLKLKEAFPTEG